MGNSREKRRLERMQIIKSMILSQLEKREKIDYEKLLAWIMIEMGVEERKAREYLSPFCKIYEIRTDSKRPEEPLL